MILLHPFLPIYDIHAIGQLLPGCIHVTPGSARGLLATQGIDDDLAIFVGSMHDSIHTCTFCFNNILSKNKMLICYYVFNMLLCLKKRRTFTQQKSTKFTTHSGSHNCPFFRAFHAL